MKEARLWRQAKHSRSVTQRLYNIRRTTEHGHAYDTGSRLRKVAYGKAPDGSVDAIASTHRLYSKSDASANRPKMLFLISFRDAIVCRSCVVVSLVRHGSQSSHESAKVISSSLVHHHH